MDNDLWLVSMAGASEVYDSKGETPRDVESFMAVVSDSLDELDESLVAEAVIGSPAFSLMPESWKSVLYRMSSGEEDVPESGPPVTSSDARVGPTEEPETPESGPPAQEDA